LNIGGDPWATLWVAFHHRSYNARSAGCYTHQSITISTLIVQPTADTRSGQAVPHLLSVSDILMQPDELIQQE